MGIGTPFPARGMDRAGAVYLPCRRRRQEGEDGLEEERETELEECLGGTSQH